MKSFRYAFRGIFETVGNERNMRIHLCFAFYVIVGGLVTQLTKAEWAAVLICIGVVTALECLNTALEKLCDTLSPSFSEGIRKTKDASAGAVLCAAIACAAVGALVFFRAEKLSAALSFARTHTVLTLFIILTLIPLGLFVKGGKREKYEK